MFICYIVSNTFLKGLVIMISDLYLEEEELTLFIDESYETFSNGIDNPQSYTKLITIAGLILSQQQKKDVETFLNTYKQTLFNRTDVVLHTAEINKFLHTKFSDNQSQTEILKLRPDYSVFEKPGAVKQYHKTMGNLLSDKNLNQQLLASTLNIKKYRTLYGVNNNVVHTAGFSDLVEMFAIFIRNFNITNSTKIIGKIVFENNSHSSDYYRRFVELLTVGTRWTTPKDYQQIKSLIFLDKENNDPSLQLVDIIPNYIVKRNILKHRLSTDPEMNQVRYDLELKKLGKFGLKTAELQKLYYQHNNRSDLFGNRLWL